MKKTLTQKGFTLVEILGVIVIVGILSVTAIAGVNYLVNNSRKEKDKEMQKALKMAAESYFQANQNLLPKDIGDIEEVFAYTLHDNKFLKTVLKNSKKESCMNNSYVEVRKTNKNNYEYKAYIYCGSEERVVTDKTLPTISITFTDEAGNTGSIASQNISKAKVIIDMTGGVSGSALAIDSYSYSIAVKSGGTHYFEAYNSGNLSGEGQTSITVNKSLKDIIDVRNASDVRVSATVTNVQGKKYTYTKATSDASGSSYQDTTKPYCPSIIKQANEDDDWINAKSYYENNKKRKVTVTCEDGDGSGCVRETFSRTWPNLKQPDAFYSYIQVKDNTGNTNIDNTYINSKDICSLPFIDDSSRVLVKVDVTYPKIELDAYQRTSDGNATGSSVLTSDAKKSLGGNSSSKAPKFTIKGDMYTNAQGEWVGSADYPNGVIYKVSISDNLYLAKWSWETNPPNLTDESDDYKNYGAGSESTSATIDDSSYSMDSSNCGPTSAADFYVSFIEDGMRIGKLTVEDKAGNKTTYTIKFNLDRTPPAVPDVEFFKYKDDNSAVSTTAYTPGTWSTVYVHSNGVISGGSDLSGFDKFQHKGTSPSGTIAEADGDFDFNSSTYEGKNTIQYRACDNAGNCSEYTPSYNVWIDGKAPTVTLKAYSGSTQVYSGVTANDSNRTKSVAHTAYSNLVNGWMNSANYGSGVTYKISISDTGGLKNYVWTYGSSSDDPVELNGATSANVEKTITTNGKKSGSIVVTDSSNKKVTINVEAWIDRKKPVIYGYNVLPDKDMPSTKLTHSDCQGSDNKKTGRCDSDFYVNCEVYDDGSNLNKCNWWFVYTKECVDNESGCDNASYELTWNHNGYEENKCKNWSLESSNKCKLKLGNTRATWTELTYRVKDNAGNLSDNFLFRQTCKWCNEHRELCGK